MSTERHILDAHELDRKVARLVLKTAVTGSYSTSDTAVRIVRDRIAELGLVGDFIGVLYSRGASRDWDLMQTTPREQCEAALMVVARLKKEKVSR